MNEPKNCFRYIWKKMRNKDIQKSGKTSWLATTNGHALSPIFYHFALLEKQAYQKMQREKLHNLHTIAYLFSCIFLFSKWTKFWAIRFRQCKNGMFFWYKLSSFLFISSCYFVLKNKIHHKMQHEKLDNLQRKIMKRWHQKKRIQLVPKKYAIFARSKFFPLRKQNVQL